MTNFFNKAALLAATAVAFATPSFAQSTSDTANGKATVKLYTPLSITVDNGADTIDFGVLVGTTSGATARTAHTFSVNPNAVPTATNVCGSGAAAANWTCGGSPKRASFNVNGSADALVSLTLSSDTITLTRTGLTGAATAADQIDLDLTMDAVDGSSPLDGVVDLKLSSLGAGNVKVGGNLHVAAANVDGVYQGSFSITADYQ